MGSSRLGPAVVEILANQRPRGGPWYRPLCTIVTVIPGHDTTGLIDAGGTTRLGNLHSS